MLKRFMAYYKPYINLLVLDLFCAFTISAIDLVYPILTKQIINDIVPKGQMQFLLMIGGIMLGIYLLKLVMEFTVGYWGHILGVSIQHDMRRDLFSHLQTLSFNYYDNNKTGQIMSRIINDTFELAEISHHAPEDLFVSTVKVVGAFVLLLNINVQLTLITFAIIPFMVWFMIYYNNKLSDAFKKIREKNAVINERIEESISGIRVVKSFTNEEFEKDKFNEGNRNFKNSRIKGFLHIGVFDSVLSFMSNISILVTLIIGGFFVYNKSINIGEYVAYVLFVGQFMQPLNILLRFVEQYQEGAAGFKRFLEVIDTKPDIDDIEKAVDISHAKGGIEFKKVGFKYDEGSHVLHNINLKIPAGETVAIVGPSGSGKTTLCNLIPRFYDVTEGEIMLDDTNIKHISLNTLRQNIGVVQQDVFLFGGTIRENIAYGKLDATDEEIISAAKAANAHEFIMQLQNDYDTVVGERGVKLSGGQKQRVSIARMFLKNPPVLILDEATSSLDNKSEAIIQQSLEDLSKNRTTFIIAHRLATLRNAKRIIVLTENGIEEEGSHEELIQHQGIYHSLYTAQVESLLVE